MRPHSRCARQEPIGIFQFLLRQRSGFGFGGITAETVIIIGNDQTALLAADADQQCVRKCFLSIFNYSEHSRLRGQ